MKKAAAFLLTLFLLLSVSVTAFAAPAPPDAYPGGLREETAHDDEEFKGEPDGVPDDVTKAPTEETAGTSPADAPETTAETGTVETQSASDGRQADALDQQEPTGSDLTESGAADEDSEEENKSGLIIGVAVCGSILLILLIIIAVLLLRKKQPSGNNAPDDESGRGIPVEIEVLSGMCYNPGLKFRLRRNLTIGTDRGCDLVFEDAKMQPMHAVISAGESGVMLEEACEAGVTYIGGMKIFAPNRLRSGDIITIGSTSFRITFDEN